MIELKEKVLKGIKSPKVLIMLGLIGILLIFISSLGSKTEKMPDTEKNGSFSVENYRLSLEDDIKDLVYNITGSKDVSVVVTLENTESYSYADTREQATSGKTDQKAETTEQELKEGYITVKTADGGEQALIVTSNMPEIRGVAIVCQGGDDSLINEKVTNAVTAVLGITKKRVYICGRKQ